MANGKAGSALSFVLLLVAVAPLALLSARMSDEEWDAPRELVGERKRAPRPVGQTVTPAPAPAA